MTTILRCPVCQQALTRLERRYACALGHSFDITSEGYVNLLIANQKHSKDPGDNKEMVARRRRFLEQGFYAPVSDWINAIVAAELGALEGAAPNLLDIGCGEGYYLQRLKETLAQPVACFGIDISKNAIRYAAKRDPAITFAVASVVALPFLDGTLDLLLNMFAPASLTECIRVLKPGGKLVVLNPGPNHLYSLREQVYAQAVQHSQATFIERFGQDFTLIETHPIQYPLSLPSQTEIMDLLLMTPYFWRMSAEARARLEQLPRLETEVDMLVSILEKPDGASAAPA